MKRLFMLMMTLCFMQGVSAQEAVDLGLSVDWADYNIGAESIEDSGVMYLYGSTIEYIRNARYKGVTIPNYDRDYSGDPHKDPSTIMWGETWRTPTCDEWQELISKCIWKRYNYVNDRGEQCEGYEVTGPNGNSILLPFFPTSNINGRGDYQCSTPHEKFPTKMKHVICLSNKGGSIFVTTWGIRSFQINQGAVYRPVCDK